eukprot:5966-Heterococcus_DN1.PRE.2
MRERVRQSASAADNLSNANAAECAADALNGVIVYVIAQEEHMNSLNSLMRRTCKGAGKVQQAAHIVLFI